MFWHWRNLVPRAFHSFLGGWRERALEAGLRGLKLHGKGEADIRNIRGVVETAGPGAEVCGKRGVRGPGVCGKLGVRSPRVCGKQGVSLLVFLITFLPEFLVSFSL